MNKELAKTLTTALVQFIDSERPEGTMCCSDTECAGLEKMFERECFDIIEAFIQKKLLRLTKFEQEVSDIVEYCKEHGEHVAFDYAKRHARTLLALAREQLIKDGYIIEKKAFHDAVEKVDPEVMKEVSDSVDKANEEEPTEFEKFMDKVVDDAIRETYSKDGFYDICRDALALAKKEILKDLPRWRSDWKTSMVDKPDIIGEYLCYKEHKIKISDLEKLPGFKEDEK